MYRRHTPSTLLRLAFVVTLVTTLTLQLATTSRSRAQSGATVEMHYLFGSGSTHGGRPITLRIELTGPAPAGGAVVRLTSERPDLIPLPSTVTVPAGQTEHTFTNPTNPSDDDSHVRVSAGYGGRTVGREIQILEPRLRALYLQTVIRAEGHGKVTVCLTGEAPSGGIAVALSGDNQAALMVPPAITIPESSACLSIAVDAGAVEEDTDVLVTARYKGVSRFRETIVRDFGDDPTATATATDIPPTVTSTNVAPTVTTVPPTSTATSTNVPPTATSTATATAIPPTATATVDPVSAGCQAMNDPSYDVMDSLESLTQNFFAGEMFTITAGLPTDGGVPTSIVLEFNDVNVDQDVFPGTLTYTVPADGIAEVKWFRNGAIGEVSWTVACMPAATR